MLRSNPPDAQAGLPPRAFVPQAGASAAPLPAPAGAGAAAAPTLDAWPTGQAAVVAAVGARADAPEWAQWLEEIGFIPGERVTVMARGLPGGDPLVVRVGNSTFALRRAEAACVVLIRPAP